MKTDKELLEQDINKLKEEVGSYVDDSTISEIVKTKDYYKNQYKEAKKEYKQLCKKYKINKLNITSKFISLALITPLALSITLGSYMIYNSLDKEYSINKEYSYINSYISDDFSYEKSYESTGNNEYIYLTLQSPYEKKDENIYVSEIYHYKINNTDSFSISDIENLYKENYYETLYDLEHYKLSNKNIQFSDSYTENIYSDKIPEENKGNIIIEYNLIDDSKEPKIIKGKRSHSFDFYLFFILLELMNLCISSLVTVMPLYCIDNFSSYDTDNLFKSKTKIMKNELYNSQFKNLSNKKEEIKTLKKLKKKRGK